MVGRRPLPQRVSLRHHVEVLAAGDLSAHRLDDRKRSLECGLFHAGTVQHLSRPHNQQVAEQDRTSFAESSRIT